MKAKPIIQMDKQNNVLAHFKSTYDAEKITDIDRAYILKVLKGRRKSTFGYKWKYENASGLL